MVGINVDVCDHLVLVLVLNFSLLIWDVASPEVRQAYKQFIGAVVELIGGEVVSEEFREVALTTYRLFSDQGEEDNDSRRIAAKKYNLFLSIS